MNKKSKIFRVISTKLTKVWQPLAKVGEIYWRDRSLYRSQWFWRGVGVSLGFGSSALLVGWGWYGLSRNLPKSTDDILTYSRPETLTIQAADGTVLQEIGPVSHDKLTIEEVPPQVIEAFIASEDRRFYKHGGIDYQGILRAIWSNLQARKVREGGSTITQQLARIVFLDQRRSLGRKLKEVIVAGKIEGQFDKDKILQQYLNLVYLGSGAYGVADAAWVYFSKPVEELTLAEAATLAGIIPAPSLYSPLQNEELAKERRNLVLQRMVEEGFISVAEAQSASDSPLTLQPSKPKRLERQAPYFTEYVQEQLPQYISPEQLQAGGIVVETTLNAQWQGAAETAVEKAVKTYGKWQRFEQAALVAIDPHNGQIKVMVGGGDFASNQYNRVTQAQRQPGSTFKTFVYATAIAAGFSPNRGFLDTPYVVDGYQPKNFGDKYRGSYVSMRDALKSSINVVAVRTLVDVGWNPIIKIAQKMGIESELQPTYSLALGASEVNLLELTSSYGTLANQGIHHPPYAIQRILDRQGQIIYQAKSKSEKALDEDTSAIMSWMLQGVVTSGTGSPAQIGRPVAGKTGTSDKSRDLWFVGYIPQLVTGVWMGNDDNQPTWGASGTAAVLWRKFMLAAVEDMPIESFPKLPQKLDGRKGIIKAEPIKPKHSYYSKKGQSSSSESPSRRRTRVVRRRTRSAQPSAQTSSQPSVQPSSQTRKVRASQPQPKPQPQAAPSRRAPKPSNPVPVSAPKAPPAPAPAIQKPAKPAPAVAPTPVTAPAPAPELTPLAPPAARKTGDTPD